jgi:hypothetical protein
MPSEVISTVCFINRPISNTNTAASQIILFYWLHCAHMLMLFFCLYQIYKLQRKEIRRLIVHGTSSYECIPFDTAIGIEVIVLSILKLLHWSVSHYLLTKVSGNILTYLFTELSPSWEAANCAGTQELPSILRNPKVRHRVHKSPPLVPILSHIDPVHTIPS